MSYFSSINPDVIDLGTVGLSGVTSRLRASSRTPYSGTWSNTPWQNAHAYSVGDAVVFMGDIYNCVLAHTSILGTNDPGSDTYNGQGVGTYWKKVDGKDGDVWIVVSGASSAIYQKAGNVWNAITTGFTGGGIALLTSQTNTPAIILPASSYTTAIIDYYITSAGGNYERGEMNIVNNGSTANGVVYNINSIGVASGISFNFTVAGGNLEVTYSSGVTPSGQTLFYTVRN